MGGVDSDRSHHFATEEVDKGCLEIVIKIKPPYNALQWWLLDAQAGFGYMVPKPTGDSGV